MSVAMKAHGLGAVLMFHYYCMKNWAVSNKFRFQASGVNISVAAGLCKMGTPLIKT
jgi:hypothetical protein